MSNLRTLEGFEAHLTEDLKWREAELDTWLRLVKKARRHERSGLLRGGVALLYAHWEGYIKEAARAYLEHVSRKNLKVGELSSPLAAVSLRTLLGKGELSKKSAEHTEVVITLRNQQAIPARLSYDRSTIRTYSNLSFDQFADIMHSVGCDGTRHELYRTTIDSRLLKQRNQVAHGRNEEIELQDWEDMRERIVLILRDVRTQLQNAAATESFRAPPVI
jgi:hypothetical protein